MTSPAGLLDFFILEASDYIEQLDGLLAAGGRGTPNAEEFQRQARALRGSATMAKVPGISDLAGGVERVARAVREGALPWDAAVQGVVTSAIDDLKILLRGVRTWGTAEQQRAAARLAELNRYAPVTTAVATPSQTGGGAQFIISETAEIARALDAFGINSNDRGALTDILHRTRALRGLAAIKDLPPLAEVVEAIERAAKPLELAPTPPAPAQVTLFSAAAAVLRSASEALRRGAQIDTAGADIRLFADAALTLEDAGEADVIVPIATLFFGDAGQHVVSASPNPPTTPGERFRLEVVSQAEHLRRLVADAQAARDTATRERLTRELRSALRALKRSAEGFGERGVSAFVEASLDSVGRLDSLALGSLGEAAALLANPSTRREDLERRLGELGRPQPLDAGIGAGFGHRTPALGVRPEPGIAAALGLPPTPRAAGRPPDAPRGAAPAADLSRYRTPTGKDLQNMLQQGISGLGGLDRRPLSEPAPVPITSLLYTGRAALGRAIEIRDTLRSHGGPPDPDSLAELFDLLDLATVE